MMTILIIKEQHEEVLAMYALNDNDNAYSVYCNGNRVGMVEYIPSGELIHIESLYIDKEYQGKGIGKAVVQMLQDKYKTAIVGDSLVTSVGFWQAIGADFDGEDEDLDYYIEEGLCVPFIIE